MVVRRTEPETQFRWKLDPVHCFTAEKALELHCHIEYTTLYSNTLKSLLCCEVGKLVLQYQSL